MLTIFPQYKSMGFVFADAQGSRATNSTVLGRTCLEFELVRDIMVVLVTCKYEEDPIKNEGARVLTGVSQL